MLTIRGKAIVLRPMTAADVASNIADIYALLTSEAIAEPISAKTMPHWLRIVHAMVLRQVPDVTLEEVESALGITNFEQVMRELNPMAPTIHHQAGRA
jgi:hypothetical protein